LFLLELRLEGGWLQIWIDATSPHCTLPVFGMSLLERQLRTIVEADLTPSTICVCLPANTSPPTTIPADFTVSLPLRWMQSSDSFATQLTTALQTINSEPILALEADAIIDSRLLRYAGQQPVSFVAYGGEDATRTAVLRFEGPLPTGIAANARLPEIAEVGVAQGSIRVMPLTEVPTYIKKLRRDLPSYLFRVTNEQQRADAEHFLFWSNYKGSTDFFTKYIYPPLVWRMVRPLARWRVHPNVVTIIGVILTFAAVPLYANAYWLAGFLCSYGMSVLDSVDGKLARLTFRSSWFGNILDHGTDLIHPPLWYFSWAWALGNGDPSSLIFRATIGMTIVYILDRIVVRVFTARMGRSLYSCTPFDTHMRTFISRRNINLPLFTVGVLLGIPLPVFAFIIFWQIVTFAYHATRLVQFWNEGQAVEATG
jgi:phosphatidylglycerophosphate synthase